CLVRPGYRSSGSARRNRRCALTAVHFGGRLCRCRKQERRTETVVAHKIAVIGGDGIGPEVVAEALKVVRAAGVELDATDYDLGGARYLRDGTVLPDDVLDELRGYDAILLG